MRIRSAIALILFLLPVSLPATGPGAVLVGSFRWDADARWFGGFSGIEVSADGGTFLAVTDRGSLVQGQILREEEKISAIRLGSRTKLKRSKKDPLTGRYRDSEGIALRRDGSFCISFEHTHQTGCYDRSGAKPRILHEIPAFLDLHENSTLEALAVDSQGRLLTIPENAPTTNGPFPVYRHVRGTWRPVFDLPRAGTFLPVGADFGPDGRLYVLERDAAGLGFRSRVRSWDVARDRADDERLHLETFYLTHGNLEGLSVWQDEQGRIRLTMVSDDNFMDLLRTEIVEYALPALAMRDATH